MFLDDSDAERVGKSRRCGMRRGQIQKAQREESGKWDADDSK